MQAEQQIQSPDGQQGRAQKSKGITRRQRIVGTVLAAIIAAVVVGTVQTLSTLSIIPAIWATVLSGIAGILGVLFAFLALLPVMFPPAADPVAPVPSASVTQPEQTPAYRGIVAQPPLIDPAVTERREQLVTAIYSRLTAPGITCIALTGIGGAGKSTLANLLCQYAQQQNEDGKGFFTAPSLWLMVDPATTMIDLTGNLCAALGLALPDLSNLSPQSQAAKLFNLLDTLEQPRLIVLDQFENLLDWQTGRALASRPGIGEWIDALNSQPLARSNCRILLTSRPAPQGTRASPPAHLQSYEIGGLEMSEGRELLQKLGAQGTEADLDEIVRRCDGHALSLTLLAALLRRNNISAALLISDPPYIALWHGDIARNTLDRLYQQLDAGQRALLLAFSIYREAVPLEAALAAIDPASGITQAPALAAFEVLQAQFLLQAVGQGRYRLHAIVADYAHKRLAEQQGTASLQAAHDRAARYYLQRAKTSPAPRDQRRSMSDIHDLIEAAWHFCQAGQWQEAYTVMRQGGIFADLRRRGENATLLELCQLLLPLEKWQPEPADAAYIYNHLGRLSEDRGDIQQARQYFEQTLSISKEIHDGVREGVALNNLGRLSKAQGDTQAALAYYTQALQACREAQDRGGEGTTLNNLGSLYAAQGQAQEARTALEQALHIFKEEAPYPAGAARALNGLGRLSADQDENEQARDYFEQALSLYQSAGDYRGEGQALTNLGNISVTLGQNEQARTCFERALRLYEALGNDAALRATRKSLQRLSAGQPATPTED